MTQAPQATAEQPGGSPATPAVPGGDIPTRLRTFAWEGTPFGSPDTWPQSLRSAVSICLNSRFPIAIYWGPQLALLYNDAWSPILGEKHPAAFGQPGRAVWPEIWAEIGPLFEAVQQTGEGVWQQDQLLPMHRHGYTEECYFNFTFSPIHGEDGRVAGIFNAVIETTFRVIEERRARLLRDLSERTAGVKSSRVVCERAAETLASNTADVPFCLFYLRDAASPVFRRVAAAGVPLPETMNPPVLDPADPTAAWPVAAALQRAHGEVIDRLGERFGVAPPSESWPEPIDTAVVMPIADIQASDPAGFLVVGVSPRRALDDAYHTFIERIALQITTEVGNVTSYEAERRRAEALAAIDEAKTAFFSNVSHEFRTPLTLLLGPLEDALADAAALPASAREQLDIAHRNALRLLKLVNTLLDFSRIEAGRVQAVFEPTDLAALTADLASVFRAAVERAGMQLIVSCPPLAAPVYVDRELWEKIVFNLLSNAFKFTFAGEIEVVLRAAGSAAELLVRDTGTGIPAEELPHLFERFHRVKGARGRTFEGSGIGLALVQELAKLHGGTVEVASELGHGTTFTVRIPFGTAHLPAERIGAERTTGPNSLHGETFVEEALRWLPDTNSQFSVLSSQLPVEVPTQNSKLKTQNSALSSELPVEAPIQNSNLKTQNSARVLLAEDNADMRAYVVRLLGDEYEVVAVGDGQAALQAALEQPFDLVLSDVMMPHLDGFGLLAALRANESTRTLPIVLLSARAGEEARVEGLDAGADDYLIKPFSAAELGARVRATLALGQLRRETEIQLRIAHERFRIAEEVANGFNYEWDLASGLVTRSPGIQRVLGYTPDELPPVWEAWAAIMHPDDFRLRTPDQAAALLQSHPDETFGYEYRARHKNGHFRWLYERTLIQRDANGTVQRVIGQTIDITERKVADERLHRLQEITTSLSAAQTLAEVRQIMLHQAAQALGANGAGLRLVMGEWLVLDEHERGTTMSDEHIRRFAALALDARHPAVDAVRSNAPVFIRDRAELAERYPTALVQAAEQIQVHASAHLPLCHGDTVFGVVSMNFAEPHAWDEAERVFAQSLIDRASVAYERTQLLTTVQHSEERYRSLVEASAQVVWRASPDGRLIDRQARWSALSGLAPGALPTHVLQLIHPDDFENGAQQWALAVEQRTAANFEQRVRQVDGSYRHWQVRAAPVIGRDGQLREWIGTDTDITERKRLEAAQHEYAARLQTLYEQEQAARAAAEEASRLKDEFLATVSHELRTPLTALLGYAQLLQVRKRDEAYIARTLDKMVRSAKDQALIIEDLLDVSRIVSGKLRIDPEPLDLIAVVRAALDTVRPAVDAKTLRLDIELNPAAAPVIGDANRLQQVVWNLLANAAKFTPAGGTIRVQLAPHGRNAELTVSDTGQGINPAFLPFVFDRFRQADGTSNRNHGGLGLGLAIVRHLVELHGGTVQAASPGENQGATFTVRLPLAAPDDHQAPAPSGSADAPPAPYPPELEGLRVLLVDDQPAILELLQDMLEPCGVVVRACNGARDGLTTLRAWRPDILVSDIAMPGEDGYWLIDHVRALAPEEGGTTPAVALTAYVRAEERARVLAAGFQLYVPKPVEPAELRSLLAHLARSPDR